MSLLDYFVALSFHSLGWDWWYHHTWVPLLEDISQEEEVTVSPGDVYIANSVPTFYYVCHKLFSFRLYFFGFDDFEEQISCISLDVFQEY